MKSASVIREIFATNREVKVQIVRRGPNQFQVRTFRWLKDVTPDGSVIEHWTEVRGPVVFADSIEAAQARAQEQLAALPAT